MSTQTSNNNKRNSEEYVAPLLPNVLYDGGVVIYKPSRIEYIGSS